MTRKTVARKDFVEISKNLVKYRSEQM